MDYNAKRFRNKPYFRDIENCLLGDHSIRDRISGIDWFISKNEVKGKTVLDLGCAEGSISKHFLDNNVLCVHGFDLRKIAIVIANDICKKYNSFFGRADLNNVSKFTKKYKKILLPTYDIVLFLGIFHHIKNRLDILEYIKNVCNEYLLVRTNDTFLIEGFELIKKFKGKKNIGRLFIYRKI